MKVISTIVTPIPDAEGYHLFQCDECGRSFLIKPQDIDDLEKFYCPYCGDEGGIVSFTKKIREKLLKSYQDDEIDTLDEPVEHKEYQLDNIQELLDNLEDEPTDIELLEYSIDELINENILIKYEFICCDKTIKVPMEGYEDIKYCSFCKGEILLNISE